jgi:peptidoglycan/LPS O-acetylase OafA/YrhL
MTTIGDQLIATNSRSTGFDYMRVGLAISIICFHSVITSYGLVAQSAFQETPAAMLTVQLVPMFFSLSGFLVAGSLMRTKTVISFLGLRALRIFPALCTEILLSAFILGPIFTILPLSQYFSDPKFFTYLQNVYGDIHYYLPGVFSHNPTDIVNGQLWTIPGELECYIALTLLFLFGFIKWRWMLLALIVVIQIYAVYKGIARPDEVGFRIPGRLLVLCFLCGVAFYLFRDRVLWDWRLGLAAVVASFGLQLLRNGTYFAPIPMAYMTVYLGLFNPRKPWLLKTGDYSYGLYLYGFPLQQAISAISPSLRHWWINILITLPLAWAFAALSWHLLEKRMLNLKTLAFELESWVLKQISLRSTAKSIGQKS